MKLLVLGGTTEASALVHALAGRADLRPVLSLAGRTATPALPPIPYRIGGFGGIAGLSAYLARERIAAVIDATHPFAARISAHAAAACAERGTPLVVFTRPPWHPRTGDLWTAVPDLTAAAAALGTAPRRVLLTVGRLGLSHFRTAPQHHYLIRTIDPPDPADLPPDHAVIVERGPFRPAEEEALMRRAGVDILVTKNSGGAAVAAKLDAARALGLAVVMVERPAPTATHDALVTLDAVLQWIAARHGDPPESGTP